MSALIRCDRCGRRYRGHGDWNMTMVNGVPIGYLCPDCQTAAENAEAEINAATIDYFTTPDGLVAGRPKGGAA